MTQDTRSNVTFVMPAIWLGELSGHPDDESSCGEIQIVAPSVDRFLPG
jgi:hypothetical protein